MTWTQTVCRNHLSKDYDGWTWTGKDGMWVYEVFLHGPDTDAYIIRRRLHYEPNDWMYFGGYVGLDWAQRSAQRIDNSQNSRGWRVDSGGKERPEPEGGDDDDE